MRVILLFGSITALIGIGRNPHLRIEIWHIGLVSGLILAVMLISFICNRVRD
jgi:hypothetical protein